MSTLPSDTPHLPKWPFLAGDAALLVIAILLAQRSPNPWPAHVVMVIAGCVGLAALLGVIPFLTDYAGKQDEALDERQRSLEALTRTVAESAEQISIAANGLHELNELAQRQLREAEALPVKLQERFQDFNRQLNDATATENKTLRQELKNLRNNEAEKIGSAADRLQKLISELTTLESAAGKQLVAVQETFTRLPEILAKARDEAVQTITAAQQVVLAEMTATGAFDPPAPAPTITAVPPIQTPTETDAPPAPAPAHPAQNPNEPSEPQASPEPEAPTQLEPAPVALENAPVDLEPPPPTAEAGPSATDPTPVAAKAEPLRKNRILRKPKAEVEEEAQLPLEDSTPALMNDDETSPDDPSPTSAVSADGATRLLVTAYIGIGNRLFVRGDGPGLSTGKGIPLQFVSIGKWRWETNEAANPLRLRLFKNDEVECTSLGEITLEPGQQTEVSARF